MSFVEEACGDDSDSHAVAGICAELWQQPLFHLSLHSRELFHSNFLAWFLEMHPGLGTPLLHRWVDESPDSGHWVEREHKHLDLVVKVPGRALAVIEVKVFDIPNEAQLDRYAELVRDLRPNLLLLSLHDPGWPDGRHRSLGELTWVYLPFADLATALNGAAGSVPDPFDHELTERYCRLVKLLAQLLDLTALRQVNEPLQLPSPVAAELSRTRLHGSVGKMRANQAAALLNHAPLKSSTALVRAGFTRGVPLVEQFIRLDNGDQIGWQYQGRQWRLAVITNRHVGTSADLRRQREQYVATNYGRWFDFDPVEPFLVGSPPKPEDIDGFNGYNPNFVYRYRNVQPLATEHLAFLAQRYMTIASSAALDGR